MRRVRRLAAALAGIGLASALAPSVALAHGIVGRQDLPIPRWLFAWAAALVLVASFVALAVLWPRPRLEHATERRVLSVPAILEVVLGALGIAGFVAVVYAGFAGTQTATANLAPTAIFIVLWVGVPFLTAVLGDVFAAVNPWRALARGVAWVSTRLGLRAPEPLPYPAWLGHWPAAVGVLAFAWVELVYVNRDDPSQLAIMALAYAAVALVGMSVYGIEVWTRHADPLAVYFRVFSLLAPLHWRQRTLYVRPVLSGATRLVAIPGTIALVCTMIGSTSFDGFSQGTIWAGRGGIVPELQQRFINLGLGAETALEVTGTIGLLAMVLVVAAIFRIGVLGMCSVGVGHTAGELAQRFVHTLIPIALAYVVAHYFSALVYNGQAVGYLISDPLGDGSDLFGTASSSIDYGVVDANTIWYVQVGALVLGHVAGLVLAHDRALTVFTRVREATRSQYWMLGVMVAFTCLGLWLLSAAAQ